MFLNPFRTSIISVVHCFMKFQVILYNVAKVFFNPFFHTGYIMFISHLSTSLELSSFCELHFVIRVGGQEQPGSCKILWSRCAFLFAHLHHSANHGPATV